ncbi:MAG TPA: response regulator [Candidatus Acidoferrales bacterium]|nr:response regulator [Candidatus Acidoferrales bacterium]
MNTVLVSAEEFQGSNPTADFTLATGSPTILVATADRQMSDTLAQLLEPYPVNTVWVKGLSDAHTWLNTQNIDACLCGFRLEDGNCRDLVKQAKREVAEPPVIVVSTPDCADEYREYLAAINAGAFDFLSFPYRRLELERILRSAIATRLRAAR